MGSEDKISQNSMDIVEIKSRLNALENNVNDVKTSNREVIERLAELGAATNILAQEVKDIIITRNQINSNLWKIILTVIISVIIYTGKTVVDKIHDDKGKPQGVENVQQQTPKEPSVKNPAPKVK